MEQFVGALLRSILQLLKWQSNKHAVQSPFTKNRSQVCFLDLVLCPAINMASKLPQKWRSVRLLPQVSLDDGKLHEIETQPLREGTPDLE